MKTTPRHGAQARRAIFSTVWIASLTLAMTMFFHPARSDELLDELADCRRSVIEWNKCAVDADCAVIPSVCNSMTDATAAPHVEAATACNSRLSVEVSCATISHPEDLPPMKAVCGEGVCKAQPVTTP